MFKNLKTRNDQSSKFEDAVPKAHAFHRSPGADSSVTKDNESRLVRCQVCGFICDRERDVKVPEGSFAGTGVSYGEEKTAGASVGDAVVPAAGAVTSKPDKYYERTVSGGCPSCGSYLYDQKPAVIPEVS